MNEFDVWEDDAPVLTVNTSGEFDMWLDGAPVVDQGGGGAGPVTPRRRACEF